MTNLLRRSLLVFFATFLGGTCAAVAYGQAAPQPEVGPERKADHAKLDLFRTRGIAALEAEYKREKAGDCPSADNTYEINMCLTAEIKTTQANYENYIRAIGTILRATASAHATVKKPLDATVKNFDAAEAHWTAYRKAQCNTLYDENIDGTIRGPIYGTCVQELTRRHMHELASIYSDLWH